MNIHIGFVSEYFVGNFIFKSELIYLYINIAIASSQLNGFHNWYLTLIILFNINHIFADSKVVTSIAI